MSESKPSASIVGLGTIGSSFGLALCQSGVVSAVVGHDKEPAVASRAKKLGAVDKTNWRLIPACENSDLVILAIPVDAVEETLDVLAPNLKNGCVILGAVPLLAPILEWTDENLREGVHFVGGDPVIAGPVEGPGGPDAARADLFRNATFCLAPSSKADPAAVRLVSDLVAILGAKPLFCDALEHDGLAAAVEQVPSVVALALLETVLDKPSWRELQKVAGGPFEAATSPGSTGTAARSELWLANRENILRWLDEFSASLTSVRRDLAEGDGESLAKRFEAALVERSAWLQTRAKADWDERVSPEMPEKTGMTDMLFGNFWRRKPKADE